MIVTPLVAAWLVGSFWTGAALATIHNNGDGFLGNNSGGDDLSVSVDVSEHDALCAAKYRSYDPDTGMYLTFGGQWKECTLGL
ncbi:MAG TPA: BA14K family protein [Devosia sp.]|nr:BA14K family protein [Devosia sp.]